MLAIWPTPPKKEFIVFNRTLLTEFKTKILNDHEKRKYKVSPACLDFLRMIVVLVIAPEIDNKKVDLPKKRKINILPQKTKKEHNLQAY